MDINLIVAIVSGVFSAGVSWGLSKGEITALKNQVVFITSKINLVEIDQKTESKELKKDFNEIKILLNDINIRFACITSVLKYKESIDVETILK